MQGPRYTWYICFNCDVLSQTYQLFFNTIPGVQWQYLVLTAVSKYLVTPNINKLYAEIFFQRFKVRKTAACQRLIIGKLGIYFWWCFLARGHEALTIWLPIFWFGIWLPITLLIHRIINYHYNPWFPYDLLREASIINELNDVKQFGSECFWTQET